MADNVVVSAGSGTTVAADEVVDGTLGTVKVQFVKLMDGTLDGTAKLKILAGSTTVAATDTAIPVQIHPNSVNANGQATMANSAPVVIASNQTNVPVSFPSDQAASVAATFTPAASSHTAPACNGAAQTFAAMGLSGRPIMITGASLEIDGATAEASAWRLYLYNVTPPSATADAGAWDLVSGDRASYLGYVDLGTAIDLGSTQWVEVQGINKQVKLAGTALFGYLVNLTTLTPAAVAHIVTLHAVQL